MRCTRPATLVKVPFFSANVSPGSTTCARSRAGARWVPRRPRFRAVEKPFSVVSPEIPEVGTGDEEAADGAGVDGVADLREIHVSRTAAKPRSRAPRALAAFSALMRKSSNRAPHHGDVTLLHAQPAGYQLTEREELLVREVRRDDRGERRGALASHEVRELRGGVMKRVVPRGRFEGGAAPRSWRSEAVLIDEAVAEPTLVAHPRLVHVVVAPRQQPIDASACGPDLDVAAVGAARADAFGLVQEPHAHLVVKVLAEERADRADVGGADRVVVGERLVGKDVDHRLVAEIEDAELAGLGDLLTEAYAATAEDAAFLIEHDARTDVDTLEQLAARLLCARRAAAVLERVVLQVALTGLVADRAVERVVHEEQLEDALARLA